MDVYEKIKELDGEIVAGINWRQTIFPTVEKAQEFVIFLNSYGDKYEHRGLWKPWREDQKWKALVAWR